MPFFGVGTIAGVSHGSGKANDSSAKTPPGRNSNARN